MKKLKTITPAILLFFLFVFTGNAQEKTANPIEEEIYKEYKANGVDKAIVLYQKHKKKGDHDFSQAELNTVGYMIMNEDGDLEAAEKIFRLNMEEHPEDANPYDSYADYLVEKGNYEEAKEYYKKSAAMSKDSDDDWEKNTLYPMSKSKLAKLDKKHKQMDFLLGDWNIDATTYNDGKESGKFKGVDKVEFNDETNSIFLHHYNDKNEPEGMRIITYDAIDDEFDVAYFNSQRLRGIEVSSMKMKPINEKQFEFMDTYTNMDGEEVLIKHEIRKISDREMDWVIFEQNDDNEWQKVYAMNMTK